ncbi:MAG: thiol-disulfide isomerase, partial [Gammaproteobacteria bacterium]|nr:thiol-disulfide isomerase [Gammaproteobacteria bacterium]
MEASVLFDVLLWALVLVLGIAVLALARQVGVLSQRIAPVGALMPVHGPKVGELTEALEAADLDGRKQQIGGASAGEATLLLFVSPTCPVCKALL